VLEEKTTQHKDSVSGKYNHLPADRQSPAVRIEISDTGIGIDPEDQQAIFERFFRVENRVHTLEGTGLGLSIVRNIIDKHHTKINLVSEVNVGTTFWFDLAVYQPKTTLLVENPWPVEVKVESEISSSHVNRI
jgi:two-component system sensor histidine kinase NblS